MTIKTPVAETSKYAPIANAIVVDDESSPSTRAAATATTTATATPVTFPTATAVPYSDEAPKKTNRSSNYNNNGTTTTPTTVTVVTPVPGSYRANRAPPGVTAPGLWGEQRYRGKATAWITVGGFILFGPAGLFLLCFKTDRRDVYKVSNREYYDKKGRRITIQPQHMDFTPYRPRRALLPNTVPTNEVEA